MKLLSRQFTCHQAGPARAAHQDQPPYTLGVCLTAFWWLLLAWALAAAFALGTALGSFLVWTFDAQLRALFWAWACINF